MLIKLRMFNFISRNPEGEKVFTQVEACVMEEAVIRFQLFYPEQEILDIRLCGAVAH